ncbi:MAG: apolipoprotein N-acyltransferase [bacterium]|nr:apolipoprotein N-acyltransferase [bacterium]
MRAFLRSYGWGIASGVALALSFPTWHLYPLAWIALAPLLCVCRNAGSRTAFVQFFLAGFAFNLVLLQWLITNVYWAGGWAFWGYVVLSAILALFWGATGAAWTWLRGRFPRLPGALTLPILWMAMEYLQATVFSGFGWGSLAYSQGKDLPFLQWVAIGGAPLVSGILVAVNALVAESVTTTSRRWLKAIAVVVIFAGTHAIGGALLDEADYDSAPYTAGIVQAAFPLEMKWDPEYTVEMVRNACAKSRMLAEDGPVDLIVWPESLVMADIDRPGIIDEIVSVARDTGAAMYIGSHRTNPDTGGSLNSSYLVTPEGVIGDHYDKRHLAPFGEYVPFSEYVPFIKKVVPAIGNVEAGHEAKVLDAKGRTLGPLICFEVLFGPMSAELRAAGADCLVVITNLGWFGRSNAVPQELEMARVRAIETRLPLIHSANTGISGAFDPWGRFTGIDQYAAGPGPPTRYPGIDPRSTIAHRFIGTVPVAAAAKPVLSNGPTFFPPAMALLSALLLIAGAIRRRKGSIAPG